MRLEAGQEKRRRNLFLLLESLTGTAAVMLDAQGMLEFGNEKVCELLGCAQSEMLRTRWREIAPLLELPSPDPSGARSRLCKVCVASTAHSRQLSLEVHALNEDAGHGYFVLLKDPLNPDRLDRELILASERRGWSHQREAWMHDLKGILNSMQISLELLSDSEADAEPVDASSTEGRRRRRVAVMKEDLRRMDHALHLLPGAEGQTDPAITQFDVRELIKEIFASLRQLVRRNKVDLQVDCPDEPLSARGRRSWVGLALLNVAAHQLGAMPAGGRLAVEAASIGDCIEVKLAGNAAPPRAGMIDAGLHTLSGRLQTDVNAAALDLQVGRTIVEAHGGELRVDALADGVTQFTLRLPLAAP